MEIATASISAELKRELQAKGFYIEDMGAVWGPGWWEGQYRWMQRDTDNFQDGDTSDTEEAAWVACAAFALGKAA